MSRLTIESLSVSYGSLPVLDKLSLTLESGEIGCLLGASGCGKTTALRTIAGFEKPRHGRIVLADRVLNDAHVHMPTHLRRIGMVFQDYALFPHLTIARNIAFGLKNHADKQRRTAEMLELIGLSGYGEHYPHELSGGQQQRVALARALAPQPDLILLDEPFSNLDVQLRQNLSQEVRRLLKDQGASAILVTHDKQEAFATADKIGVLHQGCLQQWADPATLYQQPATPYVAEFIAEGTLLNATVRRIAGSLQADLGFAALPVNADGWQENDAVRVLIRPDDVSIDGTSSAQVRLLSRDFLGEYWRYTVATPDGQNFTFRAAANACHQPGNDLPLRIDIQDAIIFKEPRKSL
ncbi:MAG: ABC transporter ATP-binding protein [Neisseria sp.]|nr:ABC transporter ATP-binding protein [Neisseria sp.]